MMHSPGKIGHHQLGPLGKFLVLQRCTCTSIEILKALTCKKTESNFSTIQNHQIEYFSEKNWTQHPNEKNKHIKQKLIVPPVFAIAVANRYVNLNYKSVDTLNIIQAHNKGCNLYFCHNKSMYKNCRCKSNKTEECLAL